MAARGGIQTIKDVKLAFRESRYAASNYKIGNSRAFTNNALVPRPKFLFFVRFRLSQSALSENLSGFRDTSTISNIKEGIVFQIKQIDKPKFNINTETMNQYNKKRVVQTNIDYNPMTINFHDDVGDRVLRFWADYYEYYYGDGGRTTTKDWAYDITNRDFYNGEKEGWGFKGFYAGGANNMNFLESIELIQFYGQQYTSIEFVRPIVTIFDHDSSDYEEGREGTAIRMSFDYEGVLYHLTPQSVEGHEDEFGFLSDYYDPISSGDTSSTNPTANTRVVIDKPSSDIAKPIAGRKPETSVLLDVKNEIDGFLANTTKSIAIGGDRLFGAISSEVTGSLSNLVSASGLLPSPDLVEKQSGITNAINGIGSVIPQSVGNILQTATRAINTGIDINLVNSAAAVLNTDVVSNTVSEFSRAMGAAAATATKQGLVPSVANFTDFIDHASSSINAVVNKLPSGKFQVTGIGATIFNAARAPTSALGIRTTNSPWVNPDTENTNKRLIKAEVGDKNINV